MPSLNRVLLIGRLGKDPETRQTPKGSAYTTFSLAVDRKWKDKNGELHQDTDWFNVVAWGKLGEICQNYLSKGKLVYVEGRLQTRRYEHEGSVRYFTTVVMSSMQMLERKAKEPVLEETNEEQVEIND
ncbi:MAG TPA: single-stranded DNA-binding protein [Anaerolineaceae bacterium]|uniref:Single-stranded DNA-binding protein n=1 Tax=Anaerolinea thermophila TaxID=167964 RepID=A0A101FXL1_9CHLR|nr:MAG: Single-strand DNA-binding [Anaerolinea thermophila]HAF61568.1 single-stranded DNA-binding protein [Anaerolineaceae bacterium]